MGMCMHVHRNSIAMHSNNLVCQATFSVFICGGGKKGLVTLPQIFSAIESTHFGER